MLRFFRRWFKPGAPAPALTTTAGMQAVAEWAQREGWRFRRARDGEGEGFVIHAPAAGWRLEWGPSQRSYIRSAELRMRAELGSGASLQMLVISRMLMQALEKEVFEQFTEGLQTRIDTATPEEMRWLVLHPKLSGADLHGIRESFGATGHPGVAVSQWLQGPLASALLDARAGGLAAEDPLVLIVQRARLTLRTSLASPDIARIELLLGLFKVACEQARKAVEHWGGTSGATTTTTPSLWSTQGPGSNLPP